jgi:Fic family protein
MEKEVVNYLLKEVIKKSQSDKNIIQILHTHILFEKIHPYIDANGRLGRLILQKGIADTINFSNVLPVS